MKKSVKKEKEKLEHSLVPEHVLLSAQDKQKVLELYKLQEKNLPRIVLDDPAIIGLGAQLGDLILVRRKDFTSDYDYYRIVVKG